MSGRQIKRTLRPRRAGFKSRKRGSSARATALRLTHQPRTRAAQVHGSVLLSALAKHASLGSPWQAR